MLLYVVLNNIARKRARVGEEMLAIMDELKGVATVNTVVGLILNRKMTLYEHKRDEEMS